MVSFNMESEESVPEGNSSSRNDRFHWSIAGSLKEVALKESLRLDLQLYALVLVFLSFLFCLGGRHLQSAEPVRRQPMESPEGFPLLNLK